jgi:hypothetical protein
MGAGGKEEVVGKRVEVVIEQMGSGNVQGLIPHQKRVLLCCCVWCGVVWERCWLDRMQ